jgi:hypothetical protein
MMGILKSLEAIIAILLVLTSYFAIFGSGENIPDFETSIWKMRGFEAIKALDESNRLANSALANESEKIEDELEEILPIGFNYEVLVCNQNCPSINISSEKIVSVSYFIPGNATDLEPREVLLYMWR